MYSLTPDLFPGMADPAVPVLSTVPVTSNTFRLSVDLFIMPTFLSPSPGLSTEGMDVLSRCVAGISSNFTSHGSTEKDSILDMPSSVDHLL